MKFLGQYEKQIRNGIVEFPWSDFEADNYVWLLFKCREDREFICHILPKEDYEAHKDELTDIKIVASEPMGTFKTDEGMWYLPSYIRDAFNFDVVFFGMGDFVEMVSAEYAKKETEELELNLDLLDI